MPKVDALPMPSTPLAAVFPFLVYPRMPSFFGYTLWSLAVLVPLFGLVTCVFF